MTVDPKPDMPYRRHSRELDAGAHMHAVPLAAAARLVAAGALVAAAIGSDILYDWAFTLPLWLGPIRDLAVDAAGGWHSAMQAIGLAEVHPTLRGGFRSFQSL